MVDMKLEKLFMIVGLKDYADNSTILGLFYIFKVNQTLVGKIFWTCVVISMAVLGTYW